MDKNKKRGGQSRPLEERFWEKVDKKESNDCWNWKASCMKAGYGQLNVGRTMGYAHRYSWILHYGEIPEGLEICHKCDNRKCVNPDHLFLGTRKDNMVDASKKGRLSMQTSKIKPKDVLVIRNLFAIGVKQLFLAKVYKLDQSSISDIVRRKSWKHL